MATPSSVSSNRTAATPSSITNNRRLSISSVTSSGHRRKDQSLSDVAGSLGQSTPERSQTSEDGVSARSRQLDFGSVDGVDVDDEQGEKDDAGVGSTVGGEEVQAEEAEQADGQESDHINEAAAAARPRRGRRGTVFWSGDEKEFLCRGVEKYGAGKWKEILNDGKNVFSCHRTNVDLKDKWKNLSKNTNRKRPRTSGTANPPESDTESEEHPRAQKGSVKKCKAPSDEISDISSSESTAPRRRNQATANAAKKTVNSERAPPKEGGDCRGDGEVAHSHGPVTSNSDLTTGPVTLKFATDNCFPELVEVNVSLAKCKDVSALKEHLRSNVLSDVSPDTEIQVIGLESKILFGDEEQLSRCIQKNGVEFFLVFEENPEEFV